MWALFNILLIAFFSAIFALSVFLIEKIKTTSWFIKLRVIQSTKIFIEGSIYGVVFLGANILLNNAYSSLISFWLIGFFILASQKDPILSVISLVPATIYYLFINDININVYAMYGLIFAFAISLKFALFFSNNFIARIITYPIFIFSALITWIIISYTANNITYQNATELIFTSIGACSGELIIFWFLKTSISANILYESINYSFSKYYRPQIKDQVIGSLISKEKIDRAIYVIFNINIGTDNIDEKREITETILKDLEKELPSKTIFFQSINGKYGAFVPIYSNLNLKELINHNYDDSSKKDIVFLKTTLEKVSSNYKLGNGKIFYANVTAGVSIYGLQDYSLNKLENNALFALDYVEENSIKHFSVFDSEEFRNRKRDSNDLLYLNDAIDLSSLKLRFMPVYGKENINIVEFSSTNEEQFINSITEYIYSHGLIDIYNRYLAATAIIASNGFQGKIAIPYPFKFLNDLNINIFIKRLKIMKTELKNLIFVFHGSEIYESKSNKKILLKLKEKNANFAFISIDQKDRKLIEYYSPDYIFLKHIDKIYKSQKSIFINLKNESQLKKLFKLGIKNFAGSFVSQKTTPHILPKKSKIYIEDIKKEVKNE